ncbi:MAG: prepilin-type N-terminal cleavage/methylation domain-containing protein [Polyangiales bacterium]
MLEAQGEPKPLSEGRSGEPWAASAGRPRERSGATVQSGFTLIEVMIAIAILSLALVTVFGSNIGGARSASHARHVTRATMMARCRVTELEAWLVKNQLPPADQDVEDPPAMGSEPCCTDGVTCDAKVERIELPDQSAVETAAGDSLLGRAAGAAAGSSFGGPGGITGGDGGLAGLASAMTSMGSGGAGGGGGGSLAGSGAPSPREMAGTLLTSVYPTVKPLLEGAIRKVTVHVAWHEGTREYSFDVVEYVTNPGQTLPTAEQLNALPGALPGGLPGGTGTGTGGVNPPPISATQAPGGVTQFGAVR